MKVIGVKIQLPPNLLEQQGVTQELFCEETIIEIQGVQIDNYSDRKLKVKFYDEETGICYIHFDRSIEEEVLLEYYDKKRLIYELTS